MCDNATSNDEEFESTEQRQAIRERYGTLSADESCCGDQPAESSASTDGQASRDTCCGGTSSTDRAREIGYSADELATAPTGANLGLGCGNPTAIASLESGETVLDLGSGGGFDCFLAADAVGPSGRVIGVDMTPEMVERARENAREQGIETVEFRLGEIEHLPVPDESIDVIISNCVLNLSPEKSQVFDEAARVLRPGGRLAISDVVRTATPPGDVRRDLDSVAACIGDAASISELRAMLEASGFVDVTIEPKDDDEFISEWHPERDPREFVSAARIEARKPGTAGQ